MPIQTNIPPKAGAWPTGAYKPSPSFGEVFGQSASKLVTTAHQSPGNNTPALGTGAGGTPVTYPVIRQGNPLSSLRDTATIAPVPALTTWNNVNLIPTKGDVPDVGPHERGSFFGSKITPVIKTQFGASDANAATGKRPSNTSFHPTRSQTRASASPSSGGATEKVARNGGAASFWSQNQLWYDANNSFIAAKSAPGSVGVGLGRWSTVKTGAAG